MSNIVKKNYENEIVTKEHALVLYYLSYFLFLTGAIGIYNSKPILGLIAWIGACFSINYWIKPIYGLRRTMDMIWVQVIVFLHAYYVWNSPIRVIYFTIQMQGAGFYCVGWYFYRKKNLWTSTLCHVGVHLCGNLSLCLFYIL
jgi:hypothetical protein